MTTTTNFAADFGPRLAALDSSFAALATLAGATAANRANEIRIATEAINAAIRAAEHAVADAINFYRD